MNVIQEAVSFIAEIILVKATIVYALATIGLVGVAIWAGIYAKRSVKELKKRSRYDIISNLLKQMNDKEARKNKAIIHQMWKSKKWENTNRSVVGEEIYKLFEEFWESNREDNKYIDAIEETVSLLDTIGYFLLENEDTKILEETPVQFWSVGEDMWDKFGTFVEMRHKGGEEAWCYYFKKLGNEARFRMANQRHKNPHEPTTKIE